MKRFIIDVLGKMVCHCCVDGMDHDDGIVAAVCHSAMIVMTWVEIRDSHRSICGLMPVFHFFQNIGTEMTKLLLKLKNQALKYILYL